LAGVRSQRTEVSKSARVVRALTLVTSVPTADREGKGWVELHWRTGVTSHRCCSNFCPLTSDA